MVAEEVSNRRIRFASREVMAGGGRQPPETSTRQRCAGFQLGGKSLSP